MPTRRETWWGIKYYESSGKGPEKIAHELHRHRCAAVQMAIRFRGFGARDVRVVPFDPPVPRVALKR